MADLSPDSLGSRGRHDQHLRLKGPTQPLHLGEREGVGVEDNPLRLLGFDRAIIHVPIGQPPRGEEAMDRLGDNLFTIPVEAFPVEPEAPMADRGKGPGLIALKPLPLELLHPLGGPRSRWDAAWWGERPFREELVDVVEVGKLAAAPLAVNQPVCPAPILCLEVAVAQQETNENVSLDTGKLEPIPDGYKLRTRWSLGARGDPLVLRVALTSSVT